MECLGHGCEKFAAQFLHLMERILNTGLDRLWTMYEWVYMIRSLKLRYALTTQVWGPLMPNLLSGRQTGF